MKIIKYTTEEEAQVIIEEQTALGFYLVAVSNITEGNFLGFDDKLPLPTPEPLGEQLKATQEELEAAKAKIMILETGQAELSATLTMTLELLAGA